VAMEPGARARGTRRTRRRDTNIMNGTLKLSDYVVGRLADWGVCDIFLVPGGAAMHLNDSIGREPRIHYVCTHHEQAAAMAAEGYARITGRTGV